MTQPGRESTFDYIVVGAGSAGCVLAARLSEDPSVRVLLLEAGPAGRRPQAVVPAAYTTLFGTSRDWGYHTEAQQALGQRRVSWPRGRMLGGSSAMNDMVYIRGNRADFDAWSAAGNQGWGYPDVLPAFCRSEDQQRGASVYHGVGGPMAVSDPRYVHPRTWDFLDAAAATGLVGNDDFNGDHQDGVGLHQVTQRRGWRCSADAFLRPASRRRNLTVTAGAHVTRVIFSGRTASGVQWLSSGRQHRAWADREVVLCGGTVNTAQLMMLSGLGAPDHLRGHAIEVVAELPGVGDNLQDHLMVPLSWLSREQSSLLDSRSARSVLAYVWGRRGPLSSNIGQAGAFVRTSGGEAPDVQLVFAPVLLDSVRDDGVAEPTEHGFSIVVALLQPESRGTIRLRSGDPFTAPAIQPNYLSVADDHDTLLRGLELALNIGCADPLCRSRHSRRSTTPAVAADLTRYVRVMADSMFHPVGSCRMGVDPAAVVDEQLRVHGVRQLRVADASVMPIITRGNTHAPTTMIAERAAELIVSGPFGRSASGSQRPPDQMPGHD